jgi:hypothetical protein
LRRLRVVVGRFTAPNGAYSIFVSEKESQATRVVDALVQHLLRVGVDGAGKLPPAAEVARRAFAKTGETEQAIDRIVSNHTRMAAGGGFVTGLGGFVTLPVALPANVLSFYVLATRMVGAIAAARGYDTTKPDVRTAILLTLTGSDATEVLAKAGVGPVSGRVTAIALRRLPPSLLMVVNKGVAFRIVVKLGQKGLARFGRAVPIIGGLIGGVLDVLLIRRIGRKAREQFPKSFEVAG